MSNRTTPLNGIPPNADFIRTPNIVASFVASFVDKVYDKARDKEQCSYMHIDMHSLSALVVRRSMLCQVSAFRFQVSFRRWKFNVLVASVQVSGVRCQVSIVIRLLLSLRLLPPAFLFISVDDYGDDYGGRVSFLKPDTFFSLKPEH